MVIAKPVRRPRTRPRQLFRSMPRRIRISSTLLLVGIGIGAFAYHRWIWHEGDSVAAMETAINVVGGNLALSRASDLAWSRAIEKGRRWLGETESGDGFYAAWSDFLTPVAPPIICVDPGGAQVSRGGAAPLASAVRALSAAKREGRGVRDAEAELTTQTDLFTTGQTAHEGTFFVGYNLGVAGVQNRQAQISVRELARVAERFAPEYMPSLTRTRALTHARRQGISQTDVTRTFLGRYLTGLAKLRRSEVTEDAITDFRYAINAVNYMYPNESMPPGGSAAQVPIPLYVDWACDPSSSREPLTSLDAYAGLIAAYLASPAYQDPTPGGLTREMVRGPTEMDLTDPLREIILFGQRAASSGVRVVPENFLWAASNLQRLLHINRLGAAKPLVAARTVLGLQIISRPTWVQALSAQQGFTPCRFLRRAWDDLDAFGRTYWAMDLAHLSPTDQVLAALAVYVAASSYDHCEEPIEPGPETRAGLLRAGIPHLSDVLPGLYEQRRLVFESATTYGSEIDDILEEIAIEHAMFSRGQVPPHIEQNYDLADAADFVSDWRRALFRDVSAALAAEGVAGRGQAPRRTTTPEFLTGLEEAILLAGVRPSEVYEWTAFRDMALRVSTTFQRGMAHRYHARSSPELHWARLLGGTALAVLLVVWGHLVWWRWRLIAGAQYPHQRAIWEAERRKKAARA